MCCLVRFAQSQSLAREVETVAVCAGSGIHLLGTLSFILPIIIQLILSVRMCENEGIGASVLFNVKADLYVTGEMSHHEILRAIGQGTHVILCEHTNSEVSLYLFISLNIFIYKKGRTEESN